MLGCLGLLFGLIACSSESSTDNGDTGGSGDDGGSGDPEEVELTMWLWPGMGLDEKIAEYQELNPHIKINVQEAEYSDHHTNLLTVLGAGSGAPDIAGVEQGHLQRFKEFPEQFHNLLDFGAADIKDDFLEWRWREASSPDGEFVFGVPTDVGPMAMAYRIDIFEEAGLPTDPDEVSAKLSTWEDYIAAGRQVKERTGSNMYNFIGDMFNATREQGELQYFDAEGNLIIEESELIRRAWDLSIESIDIHNNTPRGEAEWGAALAAGDFATVFLPPWMLQNIKNNAPDTAGLWNIALMPEGSGNWGGSLLTLPKQGEHPQEAYDFISWLMSPENQLDIFKTYGNFPSTPSIYDDPAVQNHADEFFNRDDLGAIFSEAAQLVDFVYRSPDTGTINTIMGDALTTVADGQATPEEAWDNAMQEVRRQISR